MEKDYKEKWLNDNSHMSQLMGNNIIPLRPNFGYYVTVEKIEISKDIFPEEFTTIVDAHHSVMVKLDKHYKKKNL